MLIRMEHATPCPSSCVCVQGESKIRKLLVSGYVNSWTPFSMCLKDLTLFIRKTPYASYQIYIDKAQQLLDQFILTFSNELSLQLWLICIGLSTEIYKDCLNKDIIMPTLADEMNILKLMRISHSWIHIMESSKNCVPSNIEASSMHCVPCAAERLSSNSLELIECVCSVNSSTHIYRNFLEMLFIIENDLFIYNRYTQRLMEFIFIHDDIFNHIVNKLNDCVEKRLWNVYIRKQKKLREDDPKGWNYYIKSYNYITENVLCREDQPPSLS